MPIARAAFASATAIRGFPIAASIKLLDLAQLNAAGFFF
jgi:hypothetical protein